MLEKKILFIGGGNMAEGIIRGQIKTETIAPDNIYVYEVLPKRAQYLKETYNINLVASIKEGIAQSQIILMAINPQDAIGVMSDIKAVANNKSLIVSICAGITLAIMKNNIGENYRIARVMPNVLIEAKIGYSGVCVNEHVHDSDKQDLEKLFAAIGQTMFINETLFDEFTAFSCAGPAYIMYFLTALIDAGVYIGFSRKDSLKIALANLIGSAKMVELTDQHPYQITDTMTSPAGVTIEGLKILSESKFHGVIMEAVSKATKRAKEL